MEVGMRSRHFSAMAGIVTACALALALPAPAQTPKPAWRNGVIVGVHNQERLTTRATPADEPEQNAGTLRFVYIRGDGNTYMAELPEESGEGTPRLARGQRVLFRIAGNDLYLKIQGRELRTRIAEKNPAGILRK
jgi:hypothetical protein